MKRTYQSQKNSKGTTSSFMHIIIIIAILAGAIGFFLYKKNFFCCKVNDEIQTLSTLITTVDQDCKIMGFANSLNTADFLNVKEFAGNTVGSMIIAYPENWKGPYCNHIPSYKNKPLAIFFKNNTAYIVPGNETVLEDGSIVGKDIIFNDETDIENMMKNQVVN